MRGEWAVLSNEEVFVVIQAVRDDGRWKMRFAKERQQSLVPQECQELSHLLLEIP